MHSSSHALQQNQRLAQWAEFEQTTPIAKRLATGPAKRQIKAAKTLDDLLQRLLKPLSGLSALD